MMSEPRMTDLPSGTVTFLFTDIESSTQLIERHPDASRSALARHQTLLQAAIEAHSWRVFQVIGDALLSSFANADDALAAALAAQRAMQQEDWGEVGAVRVRSDDGVAAFDDAVASFEKTGSRFELGRALYYRAQLRLARGERDGARGDAGRARDLFAETAAAPDRSGGALLAS